MFSIRRVYDLLRPVDQATVARVQEMLRETFPLARAMDIDDLPKQIADSVPLRFRTLLFVAERRARRIEAFAILLHEPALGFCFLDFISAAPGRTGGGVGAALYRAVREAAASLGAWGILMECLPDDPALCRDPALLRENQARLRFYERFGARPITGTAYETPTAPDDDCPPYMVFDPLRPGGTLSRAQARAAIRAILEKKYAWLCTPSYIDRVVASLRHDPIEVRPPRYRKKADEEQVHLGGVRIPVVVNDRHDIHHIRERGYVEAPVRVKAILKELHAAGICEEREPRAFPERWLREVHDKDYLSYFRKVCERLAPNRTVYPYVFPVRNVTRPPKDLARRAGYFCLDTFTPLTRSAYPAARRAVDCALTAAAEVAEGSRLAYALVRPPGHHAERRYFGGFCYFNNAAIAAHYLSTQGKVAILDVDYHHGNGQQQIFYARDDVLTVSLHGHPSFAYPYFSGFADERGEGPGEGYNLNFPLPERLDGPSYCKTLRLAVEAVDRFAPNFLVVALGLDPAKADPTGTWSLTPDDFAANGRTIGALCRPTLVVQEGGYGVKVLGRNAVRFLAGLRDAST